MNSSDAITRLGEDEVLAIAKMAVAENETWADRAEYSASEDESGWSVTVWRLPKQPGGHRYISIDRDGKVTAYRRGH